MTNASITFLIMSILPQINNIPCRFLPSSGGAVLEFGMLLRERVSADQKYECLPKLETWSFLSLIL
jgi:hypothetical protein